ncbi:type III secretion system export apparatus subunit SctT [Duganella violaceipulchra]|uniref:Type III secretion protein T n=1 Tax=Duganella violaceipulchra TaxID=2849652 RepID=A0AA41H604_9BURK|nr:type III secretion system export apparatus subunit SctT [Duganella violaceicalia]MBV6322462.1 type III secretion system export apparatus subunit SctT [Duganella violaceicalia]MCP2010667.1 type III secretion protein T [Duganella violaceicalia]
MSSPAIDSLLLMASALALAMPRALGCALVLPALGRQNMAGMQRAALCTAISLPQACLLQSLLERHSLAVSYASALALKEVLIGAMLGFLLATPFWAIRAAGTLIDNQRGANAAQQINPALQSDSSILGEFCERALLVYLIDIGVFKLIFDVLADSYLLWPALAPLPQFDPPARVALMAAFTDMTAGALLYSAPALLLLLLVEFLMAIGSTVVQGMDVYQAAMPVKALLALLMLLLCFPGLTLTVAGAAGQFWGAGLAGMLRP